MPVVLVIIPYRIAQVEVTLGRGLDAPSTPLQDFVASPTRVDVFLQSLATSHDINGAANAWLFPGLLPVLLALVAVAAGCATMARRIKLPVITTMSRRYQLPLVALSIAGLSWALLAAAPSFLRAGDGLTAQSYDNARIIWNGYLSIGEAGRYDFGFTTDDDARLTIDNRVIVDRRADQQSARQQEAW